MDELRNGAERLLQKAQAEFDAGSFQACIETTGELESRHPGSPQSNQARGIAAHAQERLAGIAAERRKEDVNKKAAEAKRIADATLHMAKTTDDVRGITFFRHRESPKFVNTHSEIFLYFGVKDGAPLPLRLSIS